MLTDKYRGSFPRWLCGDLMKTYYKKIDDCALSDIYEFEEEQLSKFKDEFDEVCSVISKAHGWNYRAYISRYVDKTHRMTRKPFDGYTAILQADFTDGDGELVELENEDVLNFFGYITIISFDIFKRKFEVSQERPTELRSEIRRFVEDFGKC